MSNDILDHQIIDLNNLKAKLNKAVNEVQIISTIALLVISVYFGLGSILMWALAILGGQVISLLINRSKIQRLKSKVDKAIF